MSGTLVHIAEQDQVKQNQAIRDLFAGRSNAVGTVTLTAGAASTAVTAINCGAASRVFLFPKTANAAAIVAATYVSSVGQGTFTITHTNNANADKTFFWVALG
jgi:3-deoxy-D-arabino-heptulosonate 7-phosphate (DAHP) synthase